ncbi:autotransporter family protein [Fusobacterium ulcerans]|uniref:autotransporter family protein n=1 Tax=Fusobacterium ulcerans TaxID=861 RepID=UPI001D0B74EF|nr:autotransporter outer membrane beta-barrel domain-containing protein [Fusobacterium ulcerans]MCB8565286.1 autotransporter outer membrane beta-barrel domain-containing protein [Fusobacterium ulcerans]MCB8649230.1 autotransporter outer membrane beta-barrel domain-containing protein [Fusobacterium ulcerans]
MIGKLLKMVKSSNKKRGRNITVGAVVGMLLSCSSVMKADEFLWIRDNGGEIEYNTAITTDDNGTTGNWSNANPYSERNTMESGTYTNNITLLGKDNGKKYGSFLGYGLRFSGDLKELNFINNGNINADISKSGSSYGIYVDSAKNMGDIENNGNIQAIVLSGGYTGTGICILNAEKVGNIINNGNINAFTNISGKSLSGIEVALTTETGNVINNGNISAYTRASSIGSFYGIRLTSLDNNIENNGSILAGAPNERGGDAIGVMAIGDRNVINNGDIRAYSDDETEGINASDIKNIINNGSISAFANEFTNLDNRDSRYGIALSQDSAGGNVTNTGVIFGGGEIIHINPYNTENIASVSNCGMFILGFGDSIISDPSKVTQYENYGMNITNINNKTTSGAVSEDKDFVVALGDEVKDLADTDGKIKVTMGFDGNKELEREMTIKNATLDGASGTAIATNTIEFSTTGEYDNHILNGKYNTITVTGDGEIEGSVINAFGTAVLFGDNGKKLTLSGSIVNGGVSNILLEKNTTLGTSIEGSDDGDILVLQAGTITYEGAGTKLQNTIINGNIALGKGNDTLTLGNGTIVNGILDGGSEDTKGIENDILNLGMASDPNTAENINILHDITNFETINILTKTTLFEKTLENKALSITGANEIKIGKAGELLLRLNITDLDSNGKIKGHALYENAGTISTEGGKLVLVLNGAGNKSIVDFKDNSLNDSLKTAFETENENEVNFVTSSLLHHVKRLSGNEVEILVREKVPEILKYKKLNEIYQGIISVDGVGNFNVGENDEEISLFLGYLNDIYAGNPYSYSSELSRKSTGMFRDIVTENIFRPETNKWMIYGGLTHVDGGTKDTYYGKGYYTYDIGSNDMDADTKITGAYMLGEYGISDTLTSGVVIGGNKLKSDLSNGSKVDGSAMYLGAYAKKYVGNLKVTAGLGFQYGDYDADRMAVNKVASDSAKSVMSYSSSYNDITYDIYLNGRYSNPIGENLFLEPYTTLSYTYVDQDGADEGSKDLSLKTDSKSFDYTVGKVGVDLKKVIPHEKGKSTLSAGVSYTRIFSGADEEYITGKFKGESAKDFDILVAHKNEHSIGLNAKYALELENGIIFDVKGTYSVERDSNNNSGKNKTKGEWIVGAGLGYKF